MLIFISKTNWSLNDSSERIWMKSYKMNYVAIWKYEKKKEFLIMNKERFLSVKKTSLNLELKV
jgi:hypothetical protein